MKTKYWKVLGKDRRACNGGIGRWPKPGTWLEVQGELIVCERGLHVCRRQDLIVWLGAQIWEVEVDESAGILVAGNKVVCHRARLAKQLKTWHAKTARLFVADCAERVLPIYEKQYPDDGRPRNAIQAARDYARGKINKRALIAAGDAAGAAARDAWADWAAGADWAAWAAWAAARDAWAAWAAARDAWAAWAAARDAGAAWAAERKWQTCRLFEYLYPKEVLYDQNRSHNAGL